MAYGLCRDNENRVDFMGRFISRIANTPFQTTKPIIDLTADPFENQFLQFRLAHIVGNFHINPDSAGRYNNACRTSPLPMSLANFL